MRFCPFDASTGGPVEACKRKLLIRSSWFAVFVVCGAGFERLNVALIRCRMFGLGFCFSLCQVFFHSLDFFVFALAALFSWMRHRFRITLSARNCHDVRHKVRLVGFGYCAGTGNFFFDGWVSVIGDGSAAGYSCVESFAFAEFDFSATSYPCLVVFRL